MIGGIPHRQCRSSMRRVK